MAIIVCRKQVEWLKAGRMAKCRPILGFCILFGWEGLLYHGSLLSFRKGHTSYFYYCAYLPKTKMILFEDLSCIFTSVPTLMLIFCLGKTPAVKWASSLFFLSELPPHPIVHFLHNRCYDLYHPTFFWALERRLVRLRQCKIKHHCPSRTDLSCTNWSSHVVTANLSLYMGNKLKVAFKTQEYISLKLIHKPLYSNNETQTTMHARCISRFLNQKHTSRGNYLPRWWMQLLWMGWTLFSETWSEVHWVWGKNDDAVTWFQYVVRWRLWVTTEIFWQNLLTIWSGKLLWWVSYFAVNAGLIILKFFCGIQTIQPKISSEHHGRHSWQLLGRPVSLSHVNTKLT